MSNKPAILIVEDNPLQRNVIGMLAKKHGFTADVVGDGKSAVRALKGPLTYALVLMDRRLPDMDGLECTRIIRQFEADRERKTPIIAMTALGSDQDRQECMMAGMDDFLAKPFTGSELMKVLRRWTRLSSPAEHV